MCVMCGINTKLPNALLSVGNLTYGSSKSLSSFAFAGARVSLRYFDEDDADEDDDDEDGRGGGLRRCFLNPIAPVLTHSHTHSLAHAFSLFLSSDEAGV